ncbi:CaiB/BaiF CoA transferase family protein [Streptomyces sp. NPDC096311]|uniref:CaiB/BaiF CoA transferase family protein n=1 Tax=Streptomyces sp. NPDC096311 TaxID=3366083 RepID=UPI0037F93665
MNKGVHGNAEPTAGHDSTLPLSGITAVDLSTTLPGAFATQFLADAGADVLMVEPPGGSPLRKLAGWPALARGKRSVVLDLDDATDRETLDGLLAGSDVLVTTMAPANSERLGLTAERLAEVNPRLVSTAITGWGSTGPWRDLKGYEGLVMAKVGYYHAKRLTTRRPGPGFVAVPYASWSAAHTALHGILAALLDREQSGQGQHVEADLVRGVATLDTWMWFTEMVSQRWPDAFVQVDTFDEDGRPLGQLVFPLLVGLTKDGRWLQFAQTHPRLFAAFLTELGLAQVMAEPRFRDFPEIAPELLEEFWELMLTRVSERTLAEWEEVFATNPNISAEPYRGGSEPLDHPQVVHDGRVVTVEDPELGRVRQVSTLLHTDAGPLTPPRPAPRADEHGVQARALARSTQRSPAPAEQAPGGLPLAGVTVLELSLMFAAPYGATLLGDLGARVIKVESLEGDNIRRLNPFPEATGCKVTQGKESVAADITTEDGLRIVHELARRSDVVLQSFRSGVAERLGVDEAALKAVNPDLVYLNAPGYGTDGPYGSRPAYAPSIAAAGGVVKTDVQAAADGVRPLDEVKKAGVQLLTAGTTASLQADGVSAQAVASGMLLGLLARRRGVRLDGLTATMIGSTTHILTDWNTDYAGRPDSPSVDAEGHGFGALYRLYRAADGWIFLAAPAAHEWAELTAALKPHVDLDADHRFASAQGRADHDDALAEVLAAVFATRAKDAWEAEMTAAGVGCVAAAEHAPELTLMSDEWFAAGYSTTAVSPVFDEHRRLAPATRFSRSATKADGGCLCGEHTDAVLHEIGYDEARIADLRQRRVIG